MSDKNFMPSMTPVDDFAPKELYNPTVAAVWAVFLTPVFGEWCILQNCRELDDEEGVFRSKAWIAGMLGAVIVFLLLPPFPGDKLLGFVLFFIWFYGSCCPHERLLLTVAPEYTRKSWLKALFCGCGCWLVICLIIFFVITLAAL